MKPPSESKPGHSHMFKTDGGKTKSNAVEVPSVTLPKGGGAIKGIDEKFSVNAANGTASFSIPLPFSSARALSPSLALTYDSGEGNGVFGLGWTMGLANIKRKTDKGLPQYNDHLESDVFLFSEAEDLVPQFKKDVNGKFIIDSDGNYVLDEKTSADGQYAIRSYIPRIEGSFARIERWLHKDHGEMKWRVISKENVTSLFGWTANSRLADPDDSRRVYKWLPEFVFDDKGNCVRYQYKKEDDKGLDLSLLHNKNRFVDGEIRYANLYLQKVLYGNKTPYKGFNDAFPAETDFLFSTVFDYGEYDVSAPFASTNEWTFRTDAFSSYKAGFEIRTTRLCRRVLLFHHFKGVDEYEGLVRALAFNYDTNGHEGFQYLKSVITYGYIRQTDGTYTSKSFPAIEFEYQKHEWNKEVRSVTSDDMVHAPVGMEQPYQFTDLFNEGLSGILAEHANGWYYKPNLTNGKFANAKLISPKPSFSGLGESLQLIDLDANGGKQLVSLNNSPKGYFEFTDNEEWLTYKNFEAVPNINFANAHTRMIDLNGDGKPEILITEDNVFTWYESLGKKGYSYARQALKTFDEESGPAVVFADEMQTVFLADMSGDGMADIARIRNGEVCYWPNLGYGKFGAKVAMDHAPLFDHTDSFNPAYLRLADLDGSGSADIIYLGKSKLSCWMNLNGNAFSTTPFEIERIPEIHQQSDVTVADLLGNGLPCIVWSSTLSKDAGSQMRYIDLMNSKKPHLMVLFKNNLGKEISLTYTPSTKFYIEDKLAGKPWITKLHFPVHCVSQAEIRDHVSGYRFVTSYRYHHGYFDHEEREFRGFGMVEQIDSEHFEHWIKGDASNIVDKELHQEPVIRKTWYHTGAFLSREKILNQFATEYWYEEMQRQGFPVSHYEATLADARLTTAPAIDPSFTEQLSFDELREACRACKGMELRAELFANDASAFGNAEHAIKRSLIPYSVAYSNCVIELIQPKGSNRHAVFLVKESESLSYSYERNAADPRIGHKLNIKLDEYGNVLESATVVYPRRVTDASLPAPLQQEQRKTVILYTQTRFTNDIAGDDVRCLRLPSEVKTFELRGVRKNGAVYTVTDFNDILSSALEVPYHQIEITPAGNTAQQRLVEHIRTIYYKNDLTGPLPLHQLGSLALEFETYQLAYTPELLYDIYGSKVDGAIISEGKFTHSEGDDNWWVRSGTIQLLEEAETITQARERFYVPVSYTDPYGAKTKVKYYGNYFLFIQETEDALGNKSSVSAFNFRTLSPQRMRDTNGNFSETIVDELGFVKGTALSGKGNEADDLTGLTEYTNSIEVTKIAAFFNATDSNQLIANAKELLGHATSRFIYNLDVFKNTGNPVVVASITREKHFKADSDSPIQLSFEYANGLGQVVVKKSQAEPGRAKRVTVLADNTLMLTEEDTTMSNPVQLRWIGNGRTIMNNKGNPVKQYEPYFSVTHEYENFKELVEAGVTPVLYYDALGRLTKTLRPDGTFTKGEFDSWKHSLYDANDTCLESSWYNNRIDRLIDVTLLSEGKDPVREKVGAEKSARHANTPIVLHLDTLARPVLSVEHNKNLLNGQDEFYHTRLKIDVEGNLRTVIDARGNSVMTYKYDMLGNLVYHQGMDAGQRWLLNDVLSNPLRTWDERGHEFQYFYDVLHRKTHSKVLGGDGSNPLDHIFERIVYGESLLLPGRTNEAALQSKNILGRVIKHYDTGGVVDSPVYDFKNVPLYVTRRLSKKYKEIVNWTDANLETDLESDEFTVTSETDALGRITKQITPDGSIITPSYNRTGLLKSEQVLHPDKDDVTIYVKDIDYNEKGQRNKIIYGNNVTTRFSFDNQTFRLKQMETKRQNNDPLQDLHYTYDAVGNITHVEDRNIPVTFFNNQKVTGLAEYSYDALYRLVEATGRENNASLAFSNKDNWDDLPFMHQLNSGDPMAARNYTQQYRYDSVGNIVRMKHQASGNNWTRDYAYETVNNRLKTTQVGSEVYSYTHHAQHGFMTAMPHLEEIGYNFREELAKSIRQRRTDGGIAETTYYQYDGNGQRIRKVTENTAGPGETPGVKDERIYISGYELYKSHSGANEGLERVSLSLMDETHRFVMVDMETKPKTFLGIPIGRTSPVHTVRYQLHNHVGSSSLELNETAQVISYEEFHPFGTTAYQAKNAGISAAAKRYRYTGAERDEETGLEYHSARYYLPWLGRWLNSDPIGIEDGLNLYQYVNNDPINYTDLDGTQSIRVTEMQLQSMSPSDVQSLIVAGGGVPGPCYVNPTYEQRQADINILRNILIRANAYDGSSVYVPAPVRIVEDRTVVLMADSRGNGYIGPRYIVERQIDHANFGYQLQVLDNIRGGLGGTIGYALGGERGSYVGAAIDGVAMAAAGTSRGRQHMQAVSRTPPPRPTVVITAPATTTASTGRTVTPRTTATTTTSTGTSRTGSSTASTSTTTSTTTSTATATTTSTTAGGSPPPTLPSLIARARAYFNLPAQPTASTRTIVGVLVSGGEQMLIRSGEHGGPWGGTQRGGIPRGRGEGFTSGGPSQGNLATHVEGHAAAIMHQRGITRATLYVESDPCQICSRDLMNALPRGSTLTVISPGHGATIFRSAQP